MKFQKGVLSDNAEEPVRIKPGPGIELKPLPQAVRHANESDAVRPDREAGIVEKDRLFETQAKVTSSSRSYLKVLSIVGVVVLIGGGILFYALQPGFGDPINAPKAAEAAIREHFLTKEKRTATDIAFYNCDKYIWARVGVETRNDIPNPLLRVSSYSARLAPAGGGWDITATPITSADLDQPCK